MRPVSVALFLVTILVTPVFAQQAQEPKGSPPAEPSEPAGFAALEDTQEAIDELEEKVKDLKQRLDSLRTGETKFVITGFAFGGYTDAKGEVSSFNGGFNPIFLWKLSDRIFFESEPEIELEGDKTELTLEFADINYFINKHLTLTAGQFLTPLGIFGERLHPAWINKLPDAPLAFGHDGLVPTSTLGIQLRGGAAAGAMKFNYSVYAGNGPTLVTPEENPEEAGMLEFDNFTDNNDNKAFGGRFGFLPIPQLEIGYGFLTGKVGEKGTEFEDVEARIQAFDLTYVRTSEILRGTIDLRGEWIWSEVDEAHDLEFENEMADTSSSPTAPPR